MSEREKAKCIANLVLDQHYQDPDRDIAVLARQYDRALDEIALLRGQITEATEIIQGLSDFPTSPSWFERARSFLTSGPER